MAEKYGNPANRNFMDSQISRRGALKTALVAGASVLLSACGEKKPSDITDADMANETNPGEAEYNKLDLLRRETFDMRPEPMSRLETAWPAVKEKLSSLGSTPQIAPVAHEFTDRAERSEEEPMGPEHFEQLSHNLLIAFNVIAANQDKFNPESPEHSSLIRSSLQDSMANLSWGDRYVINMATDSWTYKIMQEEVLSKISKGGVIRELSIKKYNVNINDWDNGGVFIDVVYDNEGGGIDRVAVHLLSHITVSKDLAPADPNGKSVAYDPPTDYDQPVEIGLLN